VSWLANSLTSLRLCRDSKSHDTLGESRHTCKYIMMWHTCEYIVSHIMTVTPWHCATHVMNIISHITNITFAVPHNARGATQCTLCHTKVTQFVRRVTLRARRRTCEYVESRIRSASFQTTCGQSLKWLMSLMNESCLWMSHVSYEWVMSLMNTHTHSHTHILNVVWH